MSVVLATGGRTDLGPTVPWPAIAAACTQTVISRSLERVILMTESWVVQVSSEATGTISR